MSIQRESLNIECTRDTHKEHPVNTPTSGTARSDVALLAAWSITAVITGPVGFLLYALSERTGDRLLGIGLAGAAVLAGSTAAAVFTTGDAARPWSLRLSCACVALGVVAAGVALTGTSAFASDAMLVALPPIMGGLASGALAWRR
jgi:hypothetical protein